MNNSLYSTNDTKEAVLRHSRVASRDGIRNTGRGTGLAAVAAIALWAPSANADWSRLSSPLSNPYYVTIGDGDICMIPGSFGGSPTAEFIGSGALCLDHNFQILINPNGSPANADLCEYHNGNCLLGYPEAFALGPINAQNGFPTMYVASSNGSVYYWNGQSYAAPVGASWSAAMGVHGDQGSGPPNASSPLSQVVGMAYEFRSTGCQTPPDIFNFQECADGGSVLCHSPVFLLGRNGRVYQLIGTARGTGLQDTGAANVTNISYSPSVPGIVVSNTLGAMWYWNDSGAPGQGTWQPLTNPIPNIFQLTAFPNGLIPAQYGAGPVIGGVFDVASSNGSSMDFGIEGFSTELSTDPAIAAMDTTWATAAAMPSEDPRPRWIIEGSAIANRNHTCGTGAAGYGGPVRSGFSEDVVWVNNNLFHEFSYDE